MKENVSEPERIKEAYLQMAKIAEYRPSAPCNSWGCLTLSEEESKDSLRLETEAIQYANDFIGEEKSASFKIGFSSFKTKRAFVYSIEAARNLTVSLDKRRTEIALELLQMAEAEIKQALSSMD